MNKNIKILGINTSFESLMFNGFEEYNIKNNISYLDYDIVIINADYLSYSYQADYPETYKGKRMIEEEESHRIVSDFERTKNQVIELLKQGKNIYVLLGNNENCYVYTGNHDYRGTGKNSLKTNYVGLFNPLSFLPVDINLTFVTGEKYNVVCDSPYSVFFKDSKDIMYYSAYFNATKSTALLTVPNTQKAVSAVYEYENGKIVLLPSLYWEDEYEEEKEWRKQGKRFLSALINLDKRLSVNTNEYTLPSWADEIKILNETEEENKLVDDIKKLKKLESKIEKRKETIREIKKYKCLLTASGVFLEELVKEVLVSLGFILKQAQKGRSDIIAEYNGIDIVAEIKGVSKSAAEKHAAQLEKWVSQFIVENEKKPKSVLIVNGYCDTPIKERTEQVFPDQMLKFSESREHALITTAQLLCLFIEIKQNPTCANERISELLSCNGRYQRYTETSRFLECLKNE